MASGLPTLTIPRPPLTEIVREGQEGLHVAERDPIALARAIEMLASDAALRARMGASARARVVEHYSWARHCEQIESILRRIAS
jgi:glycosyltransferase involved in cell wall biosynthesis